MVAILNTDGSCVNDRCGGSGIARNILGQVIMAFTKKLGEGTNNWAEAMPILHGTKLCIQRGVNMIIGETNSILTGYSFRIKFHLTRMQDVKSSSQTINLIFFITLT
ncbi:hypothetical protein MTR67_030109 [Solanum verrucosum]|uniref:RNase H type-1 domain-containing protein n=1 Tax=Solanum verrucosum TaxID=315347 RepID=A0AAF0RDN1_SOLVR|nr:hypothetical protein MTR67_030109 [Solanum verrucosum]